jgi:hypothetical protein
MRRRKNVGAGQGMIMMLVCRQLRWRGARTEIALAAIVVGAVPALASPGCDAVNRGALNTQTILDAPRAGANDHKGCLAVGFSGGCFGSTGSVDARQPSGTPPRTDTPLDLATGDRILFETTIAGWDGTAEVRVRVPGAETSAAIRGETYTARAPGFTTFDIRMKGTPGTSLSVQATCVPARSS